jgi:hypothetical protein
LRKAVDALGLFVGAMPFAIAKSPQSVTVDEHWKEKISVPCIGLKLDRVVATVAVVLLEMIRPRIR